MTGGEISINLKEWDQKEHWGYGRLALFRDPPRLPCPALFPHVTDGMPLSKILGCFSPSFQTRAIWPAL